MKFKALVITTFICCIFCLKSAYASDIIEDISSAFKSGDINFISRNFYPDIELDILDKSGVYTATQAKLILNDFLTKSKPKSIKILHKVSSRTDYKFAVIELITNKGSYRISYELKSIKSKFYITQIRIESNL